MFLLLTQHKNVILSQIEYITLWFCSILKNTRYLLIVMIE